MITGGCAMATTRDGAGRVSDFLGGCGRPFLPTPPPTWARHSAMAIVQDGNVPVDLYMPAELHVFLFACFERTSSSSLPFASSSRQGPRKAIARARGSRSYAVSSQHGSRASIETDQTKEP
ncbi:hypothetical protein CDD83_6966 [Cordyceps sp. RAO-2017]|nr:hypothetical protein CDD83_6966 [Cordyceps sp. RAO-2017]